MTDDIKALADPEGIDWPASFEMQKARAEKAETRFAALDGMAEAPDHITEWIDSLIERLHEAEQERDAYAAVIAEVRKYIDEHKHPDDWGVTCVYVEDVYVSLDTAPSDILAARGRRVAAEALRNAADEIEREWGERAPGGVVLSTRESRRLRARADQIENGEARRG